MSKINKKGEIAVKKENIEPPRKKAKFESLICNFVNCNKYFEKPISLLFFLFKFYKIMCYIKLLQKKKS